MAHRQRHERDGEAAPRGAGPGGGGAVPASTFSTRGAGRRAADGDTGSSSVVNADAGRSGRPPAPPQPPGPPTARRRAAAQQGPYEAGTPPRPGPGEGPAPSPAGGPAAGAEVALTGHGTGHGHGLGHAQGSPHEHEPVYGAAPAYGGAPHEPPSPRANRPAGELLADYLRRQAVSFLRGLSLRPESESDADATLRASARRIAGVLHTFGPLTDEAWAEPLRSELGWLAATLGREPEYTARLNRLLDALRRLSSADEQAAPPPALGAARAAALLERQLTLARTRAHSATLQAMGSSRFHALADAIAVLASEVPLAPAAGRPAGVVLAPLAAQAHARFAEAASALPLNRAGHPYNAEAVQAALGAELTADLQDAPWHQLRILLRLSRYAAEVPGAIGATVATGADTITGTAAGTAASTAAVTAASAPSDGGAARLAEAAVVLRRHHEAAECAAAVASAARTPRIAPATAYALGVLHADQRHEVEAARFTFSHLWRA